jgi:hypothetical protein
MRSVLLSPGPCADTIRPAPGRAIHPYSRARHGSAGSEARSSTSVSQVRGPDFVPEARSPRTAASLIGRSGEAIAADAAAEFRWTASASTFVIAASRAIYAVATSTALMGGTVLSIVELMADRARS